MLNFRLIGDIRTVRMVRIMTQNRAVTVNKWRLSDFQTKRTLGTKMNHEDLSKLNYLAHEIKSGYLRKLGELSLLSSEITAG